VLLDPEQSLGCYDKHSGGFFLFLVTRLVESTIFFFMVIYRCT
jgi:hypothetical protein